MSKIVLTGFHGTTHKKWKSILKDNSFHVSNKTNDWLGSGIYFWENSDDGVWWANNQCRNKISTPVVIKCKLSCSHDQYINLDDNMAQLINFMNDYMEELKTKGKKLNFKDNKQLRCFCCNLFKRHNNIKIMYYSFPYQKDNTVGLPEFATKPQICVTDNDCIMEKNIMEV